MRNSDYLKNPDIFFQGNILKTLSVAVGGMF